MKTLTTILSLTLLSLVVACGPGTRTDDGGTPDGSTDDGGTDGGGTDGGGTDGGGTDGGGTDGGGGTRTLTSLLPTSGSTTGGTAVELHGEGFVSGMVFTFGADACTGLLVVDATLASCLTPAGAAGTVDVTATWPDTFFATLAGGFTYQDGTPEVDWLQLTLPDGDRSVAPGATVPVEGLVFVAGVTEGAGEGSGIRVEAGFGPAAADPSTAPGSFTWVALAYTGDRDGLNAGDLANDVYAADLTAPMAPGGHRLALRADAGGPWRYADLTGSDDGFLAADLPTITVTSPASVTVDGTIDVAEWAGATTATAVDATDWAGNTLDRLLLKIADGNLYLGVEGVLEGGNVWVVYLDAQRGDTAGLTDPTLISDGAGVLDDALSSALTTPGDVNVDLAWGTVDLSRAADAFDDRMGWRDLSTPADLGWIDGSGAPTVCGAAACEASVPLSTLGSIVGVPVAVFARIVNGSGQQAANQTLPPDSPTTPLVVTTLLEITP
ncbi:MAG: IPT/TIG domain-containing protein [Deltaproteobacteria bacterium]|nr:IPT/TIG domain-containing protein [Deltaproteobacteria bacterium]